MTRIAVLPLAAAAFGVLMLLYVVSEMQQGNGEPLANMLTKAFLVSMFGAFVGRAIYGYARLASD